MSDVLADAIAEHQRAVNKVIEDALLDGLVVGCGVSVIRDGLTVNARVDDNVPELAMFEFPSEDAYFRWLGLGCPQ